MSVITNLVAYWGLEEAGPGARADSKGGNNLGDANSNTGSAAGKVGTAGSFVASNSCFLYTSDTADLSMGDFDFSFAGWMNLSSKTDQRTMLAKGNGSNVEYIVDYHSPSDAFRFYMSSAVGSANLDQITATTFGSPSLSTWYYVVAWHDSVGNTINICVNNGTADSKGYAFGGYDGADDFHLGAFVGEYMDGLLDEVGIWKKALTPTERTWLYNGGAGRSYADIVAESGGYLLVAN